MRRHIHQCVDAALCGPKRQYHMSAGILSGSKLLYIALNDGLDHAEIRACKMIRNPYKKYDLLVIRINKSGNILCSKPCINCIHSIKEYNIDKVYYFDNEVNFCRESIKTLNNNHISHGNR